MHKTRIPFNFKEGNSRINYRRKVYKQLCSRKSMCWMAYGRKVRHGGGKWWEQKLLLKKCAGNSEQWVIALEVRFPRINGELLSILILQATAAISLNKKEELHICGILFTVNQHILTKVFTIAKATFKDTIVSITKSKQNN